MWFLLAFLVVLDVVLVWSLCRVAAPQSALERRVADEEQMQALLRGLRDRRRP